MDPRMMNAWLQAQSQKSQITERDMERKRQGIVPQAAAKTKMGHNVVQAGTPSQPTEINEQLSAEEEKYAKEHKSMLASMIKQYGEEKGTSVFYGKVRKAVRSN